MPYSELLPLLAFLGIRNRYWVIIIVVIIVLVFIAYLVRARTP